MSLQSLMSLLSLAVVLSFTTPAFSQPASDSDVAWIKQHAIPIKTSTAESGFDDLQALKQVIGDARIVSLGESTHGSREIFQMKHRLVEYLASELGFTIFSIEANMPEAYRLNKYVHSGTSAAPCSSSQTDHESEPPAIFRLLEPLCHA